MNISPICTLAAIALVRRHQKHRQAGHEMAKAWDAQNNANAQAQRIATPRASPAGTSTTTAPANPPAANLHKR